MYPKEYFLRQALQCEFGTAFVLMPFKKEFEKVYATLNGALESGLHFECSRADESFGSGPILEDILKHIEEAEFVIADLTDRNANVFYELGIAQTRREKKNVVLLCQNVEDIPFDLREFRFIPYEISEEGLKNLRSKLIDRIDIDSTCVWLPTDRKEIAVGMDKEKTVIRMESHKPIVRLTNDRINLKGRIRGLKDLSKSRMIKCFVTTDRDYPFGPVRINKDGSWEIISITLGAQAHGLRFEIEDDSGAQVAKTERDSAFIHRI